MADLPGIIIGAIIALSGGVGVTMLQGRINDRAAQKAHERQLDRDRFAVDAQRDDARRDRARNSLADIVAAGREVIEAMMDLLSSHQPFVDRGAAFERYDRARAKVIAAEARLMVESGFDTFRSKFFELVAEPFGTWQADYILGQREGGATTKEGRASLAIASESRRRLVEGYEKLGDLARDLIEAQPVRGT